MSDISTDNAPADQKQPIVANLSPNGTSPTTNDRLARLLATIRVLAARFASDTKAAARLTAKQAERTRITRFALPKAYRDLGKAIYAAQQYRQEFPHLYADIDESRERIEALKQPQPVQENQGFSEQAKAAARKTRNAATAKALSVKVAGQMGLLGKAVYEKYGPSSVPADLTSTIATHHHRLAQLDAEIVSIEQPFAGRALTPKRIAIGAVCAFALVLFVGLRSWYSGTASGSISPNSPSLSPTTSTESNARPSREQQTNQPTVGTTPDGRELETRIATQATTPIWLSSSGRLNPSLKTVKCYATSDTLIITFDLDVSLWEENKYLEFYRLWVRLFDKNGNYLTHIVTAEKFTGRESVYADYEKEYKAATGRTSRESNLKLLKSRDNRLAYNVNVRDLRDAEIVEIGFGHLKQ
jgi:hypothetical protein